jgi:hypothetical protein
MRMVALALLVLAILLIAELSDRGAAAQGEIWATPVVISPVFDPASPVYSWFPDLAVDELGQVHVVWCQTRPAEGEHLWEQVGYARLADGNWSEPNDIVARSPDIERNAIVADWAGSIHLLFGGSVFDEVNTLYHQRAPLDKAWSAAGWSAPVRISHGVTYAGDIAVDSQGRIHAVYDSTIHYEDEEQPALSDIYYRRSTDDGQIWSAPLDLYPDLQTGSARASLKIDSADVIHVTWDEGWDRLSGIESNVLYGVYVSSQDAGESWIPPTVISYPDNKVTQLTVGSNGRGGVMLVWRAVNRDDLFYQWSTDGGRSWGAPFTIPGIYARTWTTYFDMYDMATDGAGNIHLIVVGRGSRQYGVGLGVYHVVWNGQSWSSPTRIFAVDGLYPEYPKIVVQDGDQLHAVWFTRKESEWAADAVRQVWYSTSSLSLPQRSVAPRPSPTPIAPTATWEGNSSVTPGATATIEHGGLPGGLYTENDDVLRLAIALVPILVLVVLLIGARMGWLRRLR